MTAISRSPGPGEVVRMAPGASEMLSRSPVKNFGSAAGVISPQ